MNNIRRFTTVALTAILVWSLAACHKSEGEKPRGPVRHTTLIYMIANHSGSVPGCLRTNILDAVRGVTSSGTLRNGRLLVYFNAAEGSWLSKVGSTLMEIRYDAATGKGTIDTLKIYGDHKSIDPEVMRSIFADAKLAAPAESYGLVMGSHGTGWIPAQMTYTALQSMDEQPARPAEPSQILTGKDLEHAETRAFGVDGRTPAGDWDWMEIGDLASALTGQGFDYLVFDACFMSNIEALYELHDTGIEYIVASPAEVLAKGYPYDRLVPMFFQGTTQEKCTAIAAQIMDFYRNNYSGSSSASISVIKCDQLVPLASAVRDAVAATPETGRSGVQSYDAVPNHVFFDLEHYMRLRSGNVNGAAYRRLAEVMSLCVPFHDCTETIYSTIDGRYYDYIKIVPENSCGLTCYIPSDNEPQTRQAWQQTAWYRDTHH